MTQPRQLSEADLDILRRIERLPFGRFHLFGAFFAGALGDLIGRRTVMMDALAITAEALRPAGP